jgi:hypothetical protein
MVSNSRKKSLLRGRSPAYRIVQKAPKIMTPSKLTDEMRQALASRPDSPIPVQDDETQNLYVLLTKEDYYRLHDDYIRRELQVAFDQVDRGEVSDLDMDSLLAEAHRRYAARPQGTE